MLKVEQLNSSQVFLLFAYWGTSMAYFNFDKLLANYYTVKTLSNFNKYLYCVWKR